jgi:hypothetical protein
MGPARPRFTPIYNVFLLKVIIMPYTTGDKLKWLSMVDFMVNGGNTHLAETVAGWLASVDGVVSEGRRYNLLAKPIPQ